MTELKEVRKVTGGEWRANQVGGMEDFDVPDFEVTNDEGFIVFTAHGHPGDGSAEHNARAAALLPQMITLIRTLSTANEDRSAWLVEDAKRLMAELDLHGRVIV